LAKNLSDLEKSPFEKPYFTLKSQDLKSSSKQSLGGLRVGKEIVEQVKNYLGGPEKVTLKPVKGFEN
jgi:hypothetical protein